MSKPRVLILPDRLGELGAISVAEALGRGFAEVAHVAVVPLASGGPELAAVAARLGAAQVEGDGQRWLVATDAALLIGVQEDNAGEWAPHASTAGLGEWVATAIAAHPRDQVVIDLVGVAGQDGGAGLLAAAGEHLAGRDVVGIVAAAEAELAATGLTGMVAARGYGAGRSVGEVLAADAALRAFAEGLGGDLAGVPGSGAAGGTGLAVLSLNGRLLTGPQYCHWLVGLERSLAAADLVVTACSQLSALDRGGPVVAQVSAWAEAAQRPCVAFACGEELSRREVRTFGLEVVHLLDDNPGSDDIEAAAARAARSWFTPGAEQIARSTTYTD